MKSSYFNQRSFLFFTYFTFIRIEVILILDPDFGFFFFFFTVTLKQSEIFLFSLETDLISELITSCLGETWGSRVLSKMK